MALASEMIPTEVFIAAVRDKRCLYDTDDINFRNNMARAEAWMDIVNDVGGERSCDNVDAMKMRWRSLKDCYLKHTRAIDPLLSTHINRQYKNWRWAPYLSFLDPYLTKKAKMAGILKKKPSIHHRQNIQNIKTKSNDKLIKTEILDEDEQTQETNQKFSEVYVNMPQPELKRKDEIYHLFLSYSETFRKFSPKRQVMLKMDLANLFLKAEIEHLDELGGNVISSMPTDCLEQITGYDPESD